MIIRTALEIFIFLFIVWGIFNEELISDFESKLYLTIKNNFHKIVKINIK